MYDTRIRITVAVCTLFLLCNGAPLFADEGPSFIVVSDHTEPLNVSHVSFVAERADMQGEIRVTGRSNIQEANSEIHIDQTGGQSSVVRLEHARFVGLDIGSLSLRSSNVLDESLIIVRVPYGEARFGCIAGQDGRNEIEIAFNEEGFEYASIRYWASGDCNYVTEDISIHSE